MTKSLFAYPGGKAKLSKPIIETIDEYQFDEYREPFVGGGAIALYYATETHHACWINDKDIGIPCLWKSIADHHLELIEKVRRFQPSVEMFYHLKDFFENMISSATVNRTVDEVVEIGFNKLAIQRISHSGFGGKGGPKGGRSQSRNRVDDSWSAERIIKRIQFIHDCFAWRPPHVTYGDYAEMIEDESADALLYLDPPYFEQGPACYQHFFQEEDHVRLRQLLRNTKHKWVLSYDDCDRIRELYDWATIRVLDVHYSIGSKHSYHQELLITPRKHTIN
jgi:DNA adenine methylase